MKIRFLYFLLISNSVIFGQGLKDDKGKIVQTNYFEEIPFEVVHDKIIVPITIENKTYRFMLDTGAPNLISEEIAKEVGLKNIETISIKDANNNVGSLKIGILNTIQLGSLLSKNNTVLIQDINQHPLLKCYQIDGLLGSNFFKNSALKISVKQQKIWVTDKSKNLNLKVSSSKLKLVGEQMKPYIKIHLLNKANHRATEELLIDTGMGGFYDISNRAFEILKNDNFFKVLATANGTGSVGLFGAGKSDTQYLLQTDYFKINDTQFSNVITNTSEDGNSRIGFDVLKYGDMTIDFKNKKFYFEAESKITLKEPIPIYVPTM
ncbi:MAG TPA: retropepsin-like aspartic protease, partial [Flavobacterium sp.]|nr:retropepsin-like aspartic protease [Flavobacterium sp.]